jgi:predicted chitinase
MLGLAALSNSTSTLQPAEVLPVQAPQTTSKALPGANKAAIDHAQQLLKNPQAKILYDAAVAAGIRGSELAQFMAQCAHETMNFHTLRERGDKNYFLKKYDRKYNPDNAALLGNVRDGDGVRYYGRGYIQLTGRDNYTRAAKALGLDLVNNPQIAERPEVAAQIAVWFWKNRVASQVSNFHDTSAVTRPINRNLTGIEDREHKYAGLRHVINKQ